MIKSALTLVLTSGLSFAAEPASDPDPPPLNLQPIYRLKAAPGQQRLITQEEVKAFDLDSQIESVAFQAVASRHWPQGLVPLFAVRINDQFQLRRRPAQGRENSTDPLFFALPLEDEPNPTAITGRWECTATRGDDGRHWFAWEIAAQGEILSARFDQDTDYRFAFITGGTFRTNHLELAVEYPAGHYQITGALKEGRLAGNWHSPDAEEAGTWQATRPTHPPPPIPGGHLLPLYEWRRPDDDARQYTTRPTLDQPGWERSPQPLCRVWPHSPIP